MSCGFFYILFINSFGVQFFLRCFKSLFFLLDGLFVAVLRMEYFSTKKDQLKNVILEFCVG